MLAIAFAVVAGSVSAAGETPPLWGGAQAWSSYANTFTDPDMGTNASWLFNYHYDQARNASLWQHLEGQHDWVCSLGSPNATARGAPCNVIHATDGWLYIAFPSMTQCCKCTDDPAMGIVKADWLRHPEVQYLGAETVNGVEADHWFLQTNYTSYDNHYYSTRGQQRPVRFMEHIQGKEKKWDFNMGAYEAGDVFPALLVPPDNCEAPCDVIKAPGGYPGCTWRGR